MLQFLTEASGETDFLIMYPEEFSKVSVKQEESRIFKTLRSRNMMMIACFIDGKIAGNCDILFRNKMKDRHRAEVAIALREEFWNLGIGTKMFEEMIRIARENGEVRQIELEYMEGNNRARNLYEKMGFRIIGVRPNAIKLKDGTFLNTYTMVKEL